MAGNELKPVRCGCSGEAYHEAYENYNFGSYIAHIMICDKCGMRTGEWPSEAEAVEAWNLAMGAKDINVPNKERNKGKWQRRKGEDCWECSECHAVLENSDIGNHNFYYCYHCGADMMDICGYMDLEKANYE